MLNRHLSLPPYEEERLENIRNPWWLNSPSGGDILIADFQDTKVAQVKLSFDLRLPTGLHLLSSEAAVLRQEIWDFLCLQGDPQTHGTRGRSRLVDRRSLLRAAKIVDYFLLRADNTFATHGFSALSTSSLAQLLIDIGSNEISSAGIYGWNLRLSKYLRKKANELTHEQFEEAKNCQIAITAIDVDSQGYLELDDKTLIRARAVLFHMGMQQSKAMDWSTKHLELVNAHIQQTLYCETLLVPAGVIIGLKFPVELKWDIGASSRREFRAVPIAMGREDKVCSRKKLEEYRQCMLSWRCISMHGTGPSAAVLDDFEQLDIEHAIQLKGSYGFQPVAPPIIALALKNAITFFYEHGEHLLQSAARVINRNSNRTGRYEKFRFQKRDLSILTRRMGVSCWSLAPSRSCTPAEYTVYVTQLRANSGGLLDMLLVLYGACLTIVGALEAARQGEILDLRADCLHATKEWVGLMTRKTGHDGVRHMDFIPSPAAVVDVIEALASFLLEVGQEKIQLFSFPTITGFLRCDYRRANHSLDLFCDYFESPKDNEGRRYYIRQHQLRKFFAALFFHCCGFAGLDSLRWFLRHIDAKHLWHYIRGITPGEQMRHYMAEAGVLLIRNGATEMQSLIQLLRTKFGVVNLEVVSNEQIIALIDELQLRQEITFEPIFGDGPNLEGVRLGVLIWGSMDE